MCVGDFSRSVVFLLHILMTYEYNFLSLSNIASLWTLRKVTQLPHDVAVHQPRSLRLKCVLPCKLN